MMKIYDGFLLVGDTQSDPGIDANRARCLIGLELNQLRCDTRIPRNCFGYMMDLHHPHATRAFKIDRLKMLLRFVHIEMPAN